MQVESDAADGCLMGRDVDRRLLNVCKVHQRHRAKLLAWVGQQ